MRVVAILASHNRCDQTLSCLQAYFAQVLPAGYALEAVLVDDASSDGTADAVRSRYPAVDLVAGSGSLYWGAGMALAERTALARDPDALLWLNDDVVLKPDAVARLGAVAATDAIAVGALADPDTGETTYSGVRINGRHPLRVNRVEPGSEPVAVDTFNGNAVLVPKSAQELVGPLDAELGHGAADFDYGLRAARVGVERRLCPGHVGTCARDSAPDAWANPSLSVRGRLRELLGPKGYPPRSRARYLRRHGGRAWPLYWLAPYVRALPVALGRRRAR